MNSRHANNSLAPWTSLMPSDWLVARLGNVTDIRFSNVDKHTLDGELPIRLCNYVDVYSNKRITRAIEFMEASAAGREIKKFQLEVGDVLATKDSEEPDDIGISTLVVDDLPGVLCGYHLALIRPLKHKVNGPYLAWLHESKAFRAQYEARAVGVTRWGLSQQAFKEALMPLPSLPEQEHIAAFLQQSCSAIDAAVEAKRLQIENLHAFSQNLIESAVTFGHLPDPKLRYVGEDWIGNIPSHWKVCRIKRVLSQVDYGISESTEEEGRFPVLKMGHIQSGEIRFENLDYVDEVPTDLLLDNGDLLYNRTNSPDQVGKAAIFRGSKSDRVTFASYLVRLRTNHRANPYFLNYLLNCNSFLNYARKLAIPSVQQSNLNSTRYCRMQIPLPPLPEQIEIATLLDQKTAKLREVVLVIQNQIDVLLAYRKSLIHECVTGQKRVTEADLKPTYVHA